MAESAAAAAAAAAAAPTLIFVGTSICDART